MPQVQVLPSEIAFAVELDETVIEAAWRNGYFWPTICNGQGTCKTCVLSVVEGEANLSPVDPWEREGLDEVVATLPGDPSAYRLACQARVRGDVVVRKIGVRAAS